MTAIDAVLYSDAGRIVILRSSDSIRREKNLSENDRTRLAKRLGAVILGKMAVKELSVSHLADATLIHHLRIQEILDGGDLPTAREITLIGTAVEVSVKDLYLEAWEGDEALMAQARLLAYEGLEFGMNLLGLLGGVGSEIGDRVSRTASELRQAIHERTASAKD